MTTKNDTFPFGTVAPLLEIARVFRVPYQRVLEYADWMIHDRDPQSHDGYITVTHELHGPGGACIRAIDAWITSWAKICSGELQP